MIHFPISGVVCPFWLPPLTAFFVALVATPGGVSGAFLLLPFQISILGFITPGVTPTNLVYNIVAIPGAIYRYTRERRIVWPLVWAVTAGTVPGIIAGSLIRVRYLPDARRVKIFIGVVLLYLAIRLLRDALRRLPPKPAPHPGAGRGRLTALALVVGLIGGIYGVGGGAIIAPFAMTSLGLPAQVIAGPALLATLITSLVGIGSFQLLGPGVRPDWALGLLLGAGGLLGSYCGARLQRHLPERLIRLVLGLLLAWLSVTYISQFFH